MTLLKKYIGRVYLYKNRWKISVQKDGKRKTFYSSTPGNKGQKECAEKAVTWLLSPDKVPLDERTTVDTVYQKYLEEKELETTDTYNIRNRYKYHIKPIIGSIRISRLTRQDMKRVIYTAYTERGLSKKSLKNLRGDLSNFCSYLDDSDIRNDLSTRNIKIPQNAEKGTKRALPAKDIRKVFTCHTTIYCNEEHEDWLVNAYRFQIVTGFRPGELMGLEWGDIKENHIEIRRAINAKGKTTRGKNELARRDFPQTKHTRKIIEDQKKYRRNPHNPHERVFGDQGQISYRDRWGIFCKHNGIDYVTPYELRHTFASIYKEFIVGWVLDELMGHFHEGMTLGVYAHRMEGDMKAAPSLLEKYMDAILEDC